MEAHESNKVLIIDVRTPDEYALGHIPAALNLPLFTNEERAAVGTTYIKHSREQAILEGLQYVGPRMRSMVEEALGMMKEHGANQLLLYCARGGMRSAAVAWLLGFYGIEVSVYPGGFKAYKALLPKLVQEMRRLVLVEGPTGSGKTVVLKALAQEGAQVLDLEGIAEHRGSAFGALPGSTVQRSNEMIACMIIEQLSKFDLSQPVFVESESKKIGSREVPDPLFECMKCAPRVCIDTDRPTRIQLIVEQYGSLDRDYLLASFEKISKRLGYEAARYAQQLVTSGDLAGAVEIALKYYDKAYEMSRKELWTDQVLGTVAYCGDATQTARDMLRVVTSESF